MPKSQAHWGYDLLTVLLVALVSALVFWLVPAQAEAWPSLVAGAVA